MFRTLYSNFLPKPLNIFSLHVKLSEIWKPAWNPDYSFPNPSSQTIFMR